MLILYITVIILISIGIILTILLKTNNSSKPLIFEYPPVPNSDSTTSSLITSYGKKYIFNWSITNSTSAEINNFITLSFQNNTNFYTKVIITTYNNNGSNIFMGDFLVDSKSIRTINSIKNNITNDVSFPEENIKYESSNMSIPIKIYPNIPKTTINVFVEVVCDTSIVNNILLQNIKYPDNTIVYNPNY